MTYIGLEQESGSHDNFVCRLRDSAFLVKMAFEDSSHPGFISLDVLQKCIYLNGLDPVQFERPINRLFEDKPSATFAEVLLICQEHEMNKRVIHKSELLPDSRVLAAVISAPVKSVSGPRPSLGKYVVGSGLCKWCHDHGFNGPQNRHAEAACPWKLRAQERLARKGKASAALLAEQGVDLAEHDVNAFFTDFRPLLTGADCNLPASFVCGASTCIDTVGLVSSSIGEGSSFGNAALGVVYN